jgi:hypothetical protein
VIVYFVTHYLLQSRDVLAPCFVAMLASFTVMSGSPAERTQHIREIREKLHQISLEVEGDADGII